MTLFLLATEFAAVTALLLGAYHLRDDLGFAPVIAVVAAMQFLQAVLAASFYWELADSLLFSPGSCIFFAANLAILIYAFARDGAGAARSLFYGIVIANITIVVLSAMMSAHIHLVPPLNLGGVPTTAFQISIAHAIVGVLVLCFDQLLALTTFNVMRRRWPGLPIPITMSVTLIAVLSFDTVAFVGLLFWNSPQFVDILLSGLISKGLGGLAFGLTWGWHLSCGSQREVESLRRLYETLRLSDAHREGEPPDSQGWSEEQLRRWFAATPSGIAVVRDEVIVFANPAFASCLGEESAASIVGTSISAHMSASQWRALCDGRAAPSGSISHELERRDGSTVAVESSLFEAEYDGEPCTALSCRDISHERALRNKISHSDRLATVGTLAAGVAHEINNPLTFVVANHGYLAEQLACTRQSLTETESLADIDGRLEELEEVLVQARAGADRVQAIVRDLGTFTRLDDDTETAVSVPDAIESALNIARPQFRHHARLVTNVEGEAHVLGSANALAQVFLNIVINAAHAIGDGAYDDNSIGVSMRKEGADVVIEFEDTGGGIPANIRDRIAEPFFTTKAADDGTGLGLSISYEIIEEMGGEISFETIESLGTTFKVRLPIVEQEPARIAASAAE